ncbi:MAG: sugar porter family MFS transporter [Phycisphaerae bacterium]|nr:sugar porter family MFS transporter [Phycisphaerae bacterium]
MYKKLYLYTFVAALGGLLFGFDTAVISGTIPFIKKYFNLTDVTEGWAVSSALFGCIVGSIAVGKPGDIYGRRAMLKVAALLYLISAIGSGMAVGLVEFVIYRIIGGLGVGAASVLSPMYISEISPPQIRGRLVATAQLAIVSGILLAFFSNYLLVDIGENNWRWMFWAEAVPAAAFLILLFKVERSPRWLAKVGQLERARDVISLVCHADNVEQTLSEIKLSIQNEANAININIFKKPYLRLVLIGIAVGMFNQFTGINVIMYYAPTIFESAGFDSNSSLMQTVMVGAVNLTFTILAMMVIDKFGRKSLLISGAGGMTLFLSVLMVLYAKDLFPGYLLLFCTLGFVACFAASQGVVVWVLLSEMFPNIIRSRAMSMGSFSLWVFCTVTTFLFPVARERLGTEYIFGFYAVSTLISIIFFSIYLVETKGKSLEQLEKEILK